MLSLLLVACQSEGEPKKVDKQGEEKKQEQVLEMQTGEHITEYEWKTNYAFIVEQYISSYGFLDLEVNPFSNSSNGVAAAKILYEKDRDVPYLAILYAPDAIKLAIPSLTDQDIQIGEGVYIDIWDVQNGNPVRIQQKFYQNEGRAGDLAVAFVETANGETLIRTTSETDLGTFQGTNEDFYTINNLETPLYNVAKRTEISEDGTGEAKFYVNDEVSENEYLKKRKQLNSKEFQWIESNFGDKSISDDVAPIIPNVLAMLESLNTQQLTAPKEVLPIEEQAIFNKLLSFKLFEDGLTDGEKIDFANAIYAIKGAPYSEDHAHLYYPKAAMDYYTLSNFDFIFDETTFASSPIGQMPAYKNNMYIYPVLGDYGIRPDIYILDSLTIEKVANTLYKVQFDESYFQPYLYNETTSKSIDTKYFNLPKSQWPQETYEYMFDKKTKYALFTKNKYGFALIERSSKPIENVAEKATGETKLASAEHSLATEKERYLESISYANQMYEEIGLNHSYKVALIDTLDAWDKELNIIYGLLREKLPAAEMEQLKQEQRLWIKKRDAEAGNPDEVGGFTTLEIKLEYTKDRTNALIDLYFSEE